MKLFNVVASTDAKKGMAGWWDLVIGSVQNSFIKIAYGTGTWLVGWGQEYICKHPDF